MPTWFAMVAAALLLVAAWRDIATRTIPDAVSVGIMTLGGLSRATEGGFALATSACAASLVFALLFALYSRGLTGGGDVKLMTAVAFGLPPFDTYRFLVATVLAGGVLGLIYLLLARTLHPMRYLRRRTALMRIAAIEVWRIQRRGPLPYGVAIAAGAASVLIR